MPGTHIIDPATYTTAIIVTSAPKEVFGQPGVQEITRDGQKKWVAAIAVSYAPDSNGVTAPAEVLNVSVAGDDPGLACSPGTAVQFDQLRAGLNAPEKRDNGSIRGGRLWYSARAIKPAQQSWKKTDAA